MSVDLYVHVALLLIWVIMTAGWEALRSTRSVARQVGYALHALIDDDVPWHRVINARGEISRRSDPGPEPLQRVMLESEGVVFDEHGRVDLRRFGWEPAL